MTAGDPQRPQDAHPEVNPLQGASGAEPTGTAPRTNDHGMLLTLPELVLFLDRLRTLGTANPSAESVAAAASSSSVEPVAQSGSPLEPSATSSMDMPRPAGGDDDQSGPRTSDEPHATPPLGGDRTEDTTDATVAAETPEPAMSSPNVPVMCVRSKTTTPSPGETARLGPTDAISRLARDSIDSISATAEAQHTGTSTVTDRTQCLVDSTTDHPLAQGRLRGKGQTTSATVLDKGKAPEAPPDTTDVPLAYDDPDSV